MKIDMDELLQKALTPTDMPEDRLNRQILLKAKERNQMKNKRKIPTIAAVTVGVLLFGSITVLAAQHYLSPAQVAEEVKDDTLKQAFLGDETTFINETQEAGGYRVTLLGSIAGKNISDYLSTDENGILEEDRIYTVVAIERVDGTPMPDTSSEDYGKEPFYVSHYIRGLDPAKYSLMSMGGGYSEFIKEGVAYRILDMENIEMFADRGIYVGVSAGTFYDPEAYRYDETTGEMERNTEYGGVNALFELPVDKSKADPEAAQRYLEELEKSWETPSVYEPDEAEQEVDDFMTKLTPENLDEYAAPVESSRQICKVEDGYVSYSYQDEDGSEATGSMSFEMLFPENKPGISEMFLGSTSSDGLEGLLIEAFILNDDGTVTFVIYKPIL
ncbi:MAG: hypothetical protein NC318_00925 [Blautia sp.]|nr:hypothetical protein [Lachnoclostridium sp.]MCM1210149.1 hypothetical protein [Blautia sp.]